MRTNRNVRLFVGAFLLNYAGLSVGQETTTTTMATTAINSETTTSSTTSMKSSGLACNEKEMQLVNDCCKPFVPVAMTEVAAMVRKAVEIENAKSNSTMWAFENVMSAEKKDCVPPIYKVQVNLLRGVTGDFNGTKTECRMQLRHNVSTKEETTNTPGNEKLIVSEFCNGSPSCGIFYTISLLVPLVTVLLPMIHL